MVLPLIIDVSVTVALFLESLEALPADIDVTRKACDPGASIILLDAHLAPRTLLPILFVFFHPLGYVT